MSEQENNNGNVDEVIEDVAAEAKETVDQAEGAAQDAASRVESAKKSAEKVGAQASKTINEAFKQVEKQVESISKALGVALQDRANVVMVRVNDDSLHYLDMLVEADITKSRSESAAFLINEGIKSNEALFNKIRNITDQISALKAQLRDTVQAE